MDRTLCPACHLPARLLDARAIGVVDVPEIGTSAAVVERRIECACLTDGRAHVEHRVTFYRGVSTKRTVPYVRGARRRNRT